MNSTITKNIFIHICIYKNIWTCTIMSRTVRRTEYRIYLYVDLFAIQVELCIYFVINGFHKDIRWETGRKEKETERQSARGREAPSLFFYTRPHTYALLDIYKTICYAASILYLIICICLFDIWAQCIFYRIHIFSSTTYKFRIKLHYKYANFKITYYNSLLQKISPLIVRISLRSEI